MYRYQSKNNVLIPSICSADCAQGAVEAVVAVNNAVGLRFMHHEDLAVGLWVSGLYIKHIKQDDEHGPRTINLGRADAAELKVGSGRQNIKLLDILGAGLLSVRNA